MGGAFPPAEPRGSCRWAPAGEKQHMPWGRAGVGEQEGHPGTVSGAEKQMDGRRNSSPIPCSHRCDETVEKKVGVGWKDIIFINNRLLDVSIHIRKIDTP